MDVSEAVAFLPPEGNMTIAELIKKYEDELASAESGEMQSMAEATYGEIWCKKILEDLRALEEEG
jgi:hypothetical protein